MKHLTELQWKWADLFIKGVGATIIAALISWFGIFSQNQREHLACAERQLYALVEFGSAQKKVDIDVGMSLFKNFIENYLKLSAESEDEIRQTIVMLRLIAINFQDVPINLKPLFEDLDARLALSEQTNTPQDNLTVNPGEITTPVEASVKKELREQLREVAKEVANRQASRLTFLKGRYSDLEEVEVGTLTNFEDVPFAIRVEKIEEDKVRLSVRQTELNDKGEPILLEYAKTIGPFWLSYFDMPLP